MPKTMTDRGADACLLVAFVIWGISIASPALGMMAQFIMIVVLAWKCDIKTLPALLILMLGRGNLRSFMEENLSLRIGITLTPSSFLLIVAFVFVMKELLSNRYNEPTRAFAFFWMVAVIPAAWMSIEAKTLNLGGVWSGPIMDFAGPAIYFWGISMGRTYESGKHYLVTRLLLLMMFWNLFTVFPVVYVFGFIPPTLCACLAIYVCSDRRYSNWRMVGVCAFALSVATILFARAIIITQAGEELADGDAHGDTFSSMAIFVAGILMSYTLGRRHLAGLKHMIPIIMVIVNVLLVSYVITTQAGNEARDVSFRYQSFQERLEYKLYGDRAAVWRMGWEDTLTPPYIVKDMRQSFEVDAAGKFGLKLMPHNQYLTFLSRRGFWLGLVLSLFIIWVQVRGFRVMTYCSHDKLITKVLIPVGAAIFGIIGITGQSCLGDNLWGNGLVTSVFPGIVYGQWVWLRRGEKPE